ncbi:hypothetical protein [Pseudokineococcus sp. 1T1Z-3]|uniref:hypothetical protein n=1 Tax=Pseudokineococcus sp. 1T1Z-3 TaxID=3132745 RepID=UPI0030A05973
MPEPRRRPVARASPQRRLALAAGALGAGLLATGVLAVSAGRPSVAGLVLVLVGLVAGGRAVLDLRRR